MLPRWHIVFGFVFSLILFLLVPQVSYLNLTLVFLASFLIDFDHYAASVIKSGKLGLLRSFDYHRKKDKVQKEEKARGIRIRGDFHLFHTVEFHILIGLLGFLWTGFFYIFIGMIFHSMLDIYTLLRNDYFYRREYFLFNWLRR